MRSLKKIIIASTLTLGLATPAVANAQNVDQILDNLPQGEISCAQASKYWTNDSDYASKRATALAAAPFHPRGAEIRAAIARIDEAATRCNLRGTTGTGAGTGTTTGGGNTNTGGGNTGDTANRPTTGGGNTGGGTATRPAPAPAPAPAAPAETAVLSSQALPANIAAIKLNIPGLGAKTVGELIALVNAFLAQWGIRL